jgi:aspartyl-tRNA(Asn)/glutamyl-tRNA(Gln) amidotransferase subunit B
MNNYQPTIGLEIHAELKTRTKMFCDSLNDPDPSTSLGAGEHHPNTNVCPVCLGHPGTLPTINRQAVEHVIKVGLALGGKINERTKFDRKNYFYPDLPKGYQISQYDEPLVVGGELLGKRIRRIHLEEDAGNLIHDNKISSLVDFNRAGVPLMEFVTEPDFTSAEEVVAFARELQLILRYLGVSDANMEKGQMRIEANVSLSQMANGQWQMGTKTELKNINSFRFVAAAIAYELRRQEELLEKGQAVAQETRGWDETKQETFSQRSKEEAHDYRYFPEPDLPPFETKVFDIERLRLSLPEMPEAKRARFKEEFKGANETFFNDKQIENLVCNQPLSEYFEQAVSELREFGNDNVVAIMALNHYLTNDLMGLMNQGGATFKNLKVSPEHLAHLTSLIQNGKITSRQAKDILKKMFDTGLDPEEIVSQEGIGVTSDVGELEAVIKEVIVENHAAVADYKKGKTASMQFLIGKAMAKLKGRGRPDFIQDIFERLLKVKK